MKITAIIIGLIGVWYLRHLPKVFHLADNAQWPLDIWIIISGIMLLLISVGTWARRTYAWHLGFLYLVLRSVVGFVYIFHSIHPLNTVSTVDKATMLIVWSVISTLFLIFFSVIWYRQKAWFYDDTVA